MKSPLSNFTTQPARLRWESSVIHVIAVEEVCHLQPQQVAPKPGRFDPKVSSLKEAILGRRRCFSGEIEFIIQHPAAKFLFVSPGLVPANVLSRHWTDF